MFGKSKMEGLKDTIQKAQDGGPGPNLWSLNGEMDLIKSSSLVANNRADWGENSLATHFNHALLELWRQTDLPFQLIGLLQLSNNLDAFHLGGLAKGKLGLKTCLQRLIDDLLNGPPVHELWQLNLALKAEAESLAQDWGNFSGTHVDWQRATRQFLANDNSRLDLLQYGARSALGHSDYLNNIGLLQLGEDRLDLGELRWDFSLSDHLLGEGVHHSLCGEADDQLEFLSHRLGWQELNGNRGHPDSGWQDGRWKDGQWSVLGDLLDIGDQVNKLGIRVVVDTGGDSQGLSNFNADWLPDKTRDNLPQGS